MKRLLLTGALSCWGMLLRAQPQLAQRTDTTAAVPVWVPVPAAVLAACRQVAPEIVASPAATWELEYGDYSVTIPRTLVIQGTADTLHYTLQVYSDGTGQAFGFEKEISANALPWRVRWALWYRILRHPPPSIIVMVVERTSPRNQRRSRRAHYDIWLHTPGDEHPIRWFDFWRDGKPVKQPHFR